MATLVLTAVGSALGGRLGGALGAILGQRIDQEIFAPKGRRGPRLGDLTVQTSSYGNALPKIFGTMRAAGTVIWATDLREERNRSGGGKGRPKTTTYSYSASFAVALSARPIRAVRRIWADGNLLRGAAGDFKSETGFRLHLGHEDQAVDPLIAAVEGIGQAPAYRGRAYAVFEDFQLADYGNRIPSLTFEIEADDGPVTLGAIAAELSDGAVSGGALALGGYAASGDSVRGAIEGLATVAGLSVRDGGSALVMTEGGAPVTVPRADWLPGEESERAAASTIADAVALAYYEPARDYQAGLQRATRGGAGRRTAQIEWPVAISAGAAKGLAEARLARDWAGRERRRIGLPWRWMGMKPGAIVTLEGAAGPWRIAEWALEGMAVKLTLVRLGGGAGDVPDAEPGRGVGGADVLHGPTILHLFELPDLGETPATTPRLHAAAAGSSAGWRRAALALSLDAGASWSAIGDTATPAVIGTAASMLGAGSVHLFDMAGSVEVTLAHAGMDLAEADEARMIAGANLALLGNELIQFGRAVPLGGARYRLSHLLRGRRGTEAGIGAHTLGERFILIEADALLPMDIPVSSLGGTAQVMATGLGDGAAVIDAAAGIGASVRPPSPVDLQITPADGGWDVRWTRRSRQGWRWIDGVDAPIGEEREFYVIQIVTGPGTMRIAENHVPWFHYSAAMIAEDGGTGGSISISVAQAGALALSLPVHTTFSTL